MDRRARLLGERVHGRKVVHLDNDKEMVYIGMVVRYMVHLAHKVVGMVDTG